MLHDVMTGLDGSSSMGSASIVTALRSMTGSAEARSSKNLACRTWLFTCLLAKLWVIQGCTTRRAMPSEISPRWLVTTSLETLAPPEDLAAASGVRWPTDSIFWISIRYQKFRKMG